MYCQINYNPPFNVDFGPNHQINLMTAKISYYTVHA